MLPFYEYEFTLEIYNDLLKERNKQEQQNTIENATEEDTVNTQEDIVNTHDDNINEQRRKSLRTK